MISILSKAATWSPEQPFGEAFSRVFSSRLCSAQLIWTAVVVNRQFADETPRRSVRTRRQQCRHDFGSPDHRRPTVLPIHVPMTLRLADSGFQYTVAPTLVLKYNIRAVRVLGSARSDLAGLDEVVEGGAGDVQYLGDRGL